MVNDDDKARSKRDLFGDNAKKRNMGTRRLNRMPLLILTLIGGLVIAAIGYTYYTKVNSAAESRKEDEKGPAPSSASNLLSGAPVGLIDANKTTLADPEPVQPVKIVKPVPPIAETLQKQLDDLLNKTKLPDPTPPPVIQQIAPPPPPPELTDAQKQAIELEKARQAALAAAIQAPSTIIGGGQKGDTGASNTPSPKLLANPYSTNVPGTMPVAATGQGSNQDKDPNKQQEKKDFLNQKADQGDDTLANSLVQAPDTTEVKAGTVIPSVMISGINSDIPGQIIGQVSENVYDTARGRYILIPQGARLIGSFDSSISSGQQRVLVVWRRIIFPDASSINLDNMAGSDQAGYSGFHDQVNNHYLKTFGNALLLSIFSAAGQLSQPNNNNSNNSSGTSTVNSAQQTAAAALGQQLTQLGTQMIQKNMDVAPTLIIRPGYKFDIIVTKDMQLSPWNWNFKSK